MQNGCCTDATDYLKKHKESFTTIFMRDVIEHFEKKELVMLLKAVKEALVPNGKLIIQAPNAESPFFGRIRYGDITHELAFCESSLRQLMNIVGLKASRCYSCGPEYTRIRKLPRYLLWKLIERTYQFLLKVESGPGFKIVTQNIILVAEKGNS